MSSFSFAQPNFFCLNPADNTKFQCSENQYCNNIYSRDSIEYEFNSWSTQFELYCNLEQRQSAKSIILIGASVVTMLFYGISDIFPRSIILFSCTTSTVILSFLIFLIDIFWVKVILFSPLVAFAGIGFGLNVSIINESMVSHSRLRKSSSSLLGVFYGLSGIVLSVVMLSLMDSNLGMLFIAAFNIIPSILIYAYMIDGPKYWIKRGQVNKTLESLAYIFNKSGIQDNDSDKNKNVSVKDLAKELSLTEFDLGLYDITIINQKDVCKKRQEKISPIRVMFQKQNIKI